MSKSYVYTSLTRISPLATTDFQIEPLPRDQWSNADYVVAEVVTRRNTLGVELANGRMMEAACGDLILGALGTRFATLEAVGSWKDVGEDLQMHLLTGAGLMGKATSKSFQLPSLIGVKYIGHAKVSGRFVNMGDFVKYSESLSFSTPSILLVGTSMSAGKTTASRIIIRELKKLGYKILGAKLTGAGRYRDILTMQDAGADAIFDFVDVGLPSSVCDTDEYQIALNQLLSMMGNEDADIAVLEIGASPLEPYNGETAIKFLENNIKAVVLCASDPYGVYGVMKAFGLKPDLVSGIATNTEAGVQLIEKLSGVRALNVMDPESRPEMVDILLESLNKTKPLENFHKQKT
jgi:hypothetical protein